MDKQFDAAIKHVIDTVEANFKKDKEIFPVCMLFNAAKDLAIIPANVTNEMEKQILTEMVIPSAIVKHGAIVSAMVTEAWMKKFEQKDAPKDLDKLKKPVSEYADKEEIVLLNVETIHGSQMYMWDIIRPEGKDPYIQKQKEFPAKQMQTKGRYTSFFSAVK